MSPASAYSKSFFIPGREIAVRLPDVTSGNVTLLHTRLDLGVDLHLYGLIAIEGVVGV